MKKLSNTVGASEALKKEAWYRMMILDIENSTIDQFMEKDKRHYTSNCFPGQNALLTEEMEVIVKEVEKSMGF